MCDFTCRRVASAAERSHVYVREKKLEERGAATRSFAAPPHLVIGYFLPRTRTHMYKHNSVHCTHPPPPHSSHLFFHPHSGSSCHHLSATPQKPIQAAAPHRHGMLAKGDGVLSGSLLQPPSLPPSLHLSLPVPRCCPLAASQHFLNTPGVSAG